MQSCVCDHTGLTTKLGDGAKGTREPSMLSWYRGASLPLTTTSQSSTGNANFPTFFQRGHLYFPFEHKHIELYG